ncbi:alpha/beta fold hydrolase [Streptomyces sp. NBC_01387]|uniref:thioesterase II family protein n=1 Tax=unclassified Streptomyces TaxID=2593676 RepID=UPI0020250152|nr:MULTISPECIES: alpha/beta fold hydrolase [unclassified Streptomyces]WSV56463.1 alpha/beta fold hydrolase [Streptomyces sp. NBC_01014]
MKPPTSRHPALVRLQDAPEPVLDLVVVPGAGCGPTYFDSWKGLFPATWRVHAICLPGRGRRYGDEPCRSLSAAADETCAALASARIQRPVLFGHSLGALLALEVAARRKDVDLLLTAACAPPAPERTMRRRGTEEAELRAEIRELVGATGVDPGDVFDELVELSLEIMLVDLAMLDGYVPPASPVVRAAVAYYGDADDIPRGSWAAYATGSVETVGLAGNHDFPQSRPGPLLQHIARQVQRV